MTKCIQVGLHGVTANSLDVCPEIGHVVLISLTDSIVPRSEFHWGKVFFF